MTFFGQQSSRKKAQETQKKGKKQEETEGTGRLKMRDFRTSSIDYL
jgi:hypothetical protein